jgi:CHAT domain-containing protein
VTNLRDAAVASMLVGDPGHAIARLSRAVELAPEGEQGRLWSDLAAAHLQRAARGAEPEEMVFALDAADRALGEVPDLLAARFNRAVALQRLSLYERAAVEWRAVLDAEPDSRWRREEQRREQECRHPPAAPDWQQARRLVTDAVAQGKHRDPAPLIAALRQPFRELAEEELLGAAAREMRAHRTSAATHDLELARAIGDVLAAGGECLISDTVAGIERAGEGRKELPEAWMRGLLDYQSGIADAKASRYAQALPELGQARRRLARLGSPLAHRATCWMAFCHYQLNDYRRARRELARLGRVPRSSCWRALEARRQWLSGLIDGIEGRTNASLLAFTAAESGFRANHEEANAVQMGAEAAVVLENMGEVTEAWRHLYPAMTAPAALGRPASRHWISLTASWLARRAGLVGAALELQDEAVRGARLLGRPDLLLEALRLRAGLLSAAGRTAGAEHDLDEARDLLGQVHDAAARQSLRGDLLLAEGELAVTTSAARAIPLLDEAVSILRSTSYHYMLGRLLFLRAMAKMRLGELEEVAPDLDAAVAEAERQRQAIPIGELRISYLDHVKEIFDARVAFFAEQLHQADLALAASEDAKARSLLDWMLASGIEGPSFLGPARAQARAGKLGSLLERLPPGTAVVEYAVLPRQVLIWVLRRGGETRSAAVALSESALAGLISELRRAVEDDNRANLLSVAERLYATLVEPVAEHLGSAERLVFIPDGALHLLPFALLRDPRTHRYLVQDRAIAVAPSAQVLAAACGRDRTLARSRGATALVVTVPEFDRALNPELGPLASGDIDASLTAIFPGSRVLRGRDATPQAFLAAAGSYSIVHFGGHAIVNASAPLLSRLLLAGRPDDPQHGNLYSWAILGQRLQRTRLVVLASCATGTGKVSRSEGVESLARSFLAIGVPTVVASLWKVDDPETAHFFQSFYRHLARRLDAPAALRAAQVELIEHGSGLDAAPSAWGAFEVVGCAPGSTSE